MGLTTSMTGLNLIKEFEGCVLTAYQDSVGVWTIGYGHTQGVTSGMTITQIQADAYLAIDVAKFESNVNGFDSIYGWNQNEFDALVSFAFNIGSINQLTAEGTRSREMIAAKMLEYVKAGGVTLTGLVRRRSAERNLFLTKVEEVEDMTEVQTRAIATEIATQIVNNLIAGEDTKVSDWAKEEFAEATEKGITDGTKPQGLATREQAAVMVLRATK